MSRRRPVHPPAASNRNRLQRVSRVATQAFVALCLAVSSAVADDNGLETVADFGANPGNLLMHVYVPKDLPSGAPLVVIAHGCFQTVDQLAQHSGWVEVAERHRFALLFPETTRDNEPFGGCFRTWLPEHQRRGGGEPVSIRNQILWMLDHHDLDPRHVYMAGQSSGGLVTAVMLASYPELFAAGAVQSAYPYRCAETFEALAPCSQAVDPRPAVEQVALVLEAAPEYAGPRPRLALWHGDTDALLVPTNLQLQVEQWAPVLGADLQAGQTDAIGRHLRHRYRDADGTVVMETVLVTGMDHAIAIDPDADPPCGRPAPYIVDADICAAQWIGRWFGVVPEAATP